MDVRGRRDGGRAPLRGWLTLAEAAERFGAKHDRLRRAAVEGRLVATKLGRTGVWLVRPADVKHYLRTTRKGPQPGARRSGRVGEQETTGVH